MHQDKETSYKDILKLLQRNMAQIDLFTEPRSQSSSGFTELLLLKLKDIKLKMYQEKGHAMPHLHIDYGKLHHVASFAIEPPSRIEGSLHSKYDHSIIEWITSNSENLLKIWNAIQAGDNSDFLIAQLSGNA